MGAVQHQLGAIFDEPFHGLAAGELHRLSEGGGEVDVPLLAGFAADELDFGGVPHGTSLF